MAKLSFKIVGRRPFTCPEADSTGKHVEMEAVDVEWTHADGPVTDTHLVPEGHPPEVEYREEPCGKRKVIKDQINVKKGTPDATVILLIEGKREALAANLGVEA